MNNYQRLTKLRENSDLNHREMSELLGISRAFYWQIENKKRTLTYDMAKRIAKIFKKKPDDIFYEE